MLEGREGPAVQKAMEIVVALGNIYEAEHLAPIAHAHVAGVSYKNLGEAGLEFLREWAAQGARVRVPTTLNPAGLDLDRWEAIGFPAEFARNQARVLEAFDALGLAQLCTCTPYQVGHVPAMGEHVAWAESSAVIYANSVLGARTNREGGPGALAAAIAGRVAAYGLHIDAGRAPTHIIDVRCPLRDEADFGALGYLIGERMKQGVAYFRGIDPQTIAPHCLKLLGAAIATASAVALCHVEGVTPEARAGLEPSPGTPVIEVADLDEGRRISNAPLDIDLVWVGCPHATLDEIAAVVSLLDGRKVATDLWVTTAREIRAQAAGRGLLAAIEASGGQIISNTCVVVAPVEVMGYKTMATNSRKGIYFAPGHAGLEVRYGSLAQLVETAVSGRWEVAS